MCLLILTQPIAYGKDNPKITFTFKPTNNLTFTQKFTSIREKHLGSTGHKKEETKTTSKITYKQTSTGWDVIIRPQESIHIRNGEVVKNLIQDLISNLNITYKLDAQGKILDIIGYDELSKVFKERFPLQAASLFSNMVKVETLKEREISEWNRRIGNLIGKTVSIGETWNHDEPFKLPNDTVLTYQVKTLFAEMKPCGPQNQNQCIQIIQEYTTDAAKVSGMLTDMMQKVTGATTPKDEKKNSEPDKNPSSIQGKVMRLIDPQTMRIYDESSERTMRVEVDVPEQGRLPSVVVETQKYVNEF